MFKSSYIEQSIESRYFALRAIRFHAYVNLHRLGSFQNRQNLSLKRHNFYKFIIFLKIEFSRPATDQMITMSKIFAQLGSLSHPAGVKRTTLVVH